MAEVMRWRCPCARELLRWCRPATRGPPSPGTGTVVRTSARPAGGHGPHNARRAAAVHCRPRVDAHISHRGEPAAVRPRLAEEGGDAPWRVGPRRARPRGGCLRPRPRAAPVSDYTPARRPIPRQVLHHPRHVHILAAASPAEYRRGGLWLRGGGRRGGGRGGTTGTGVEEGWLPAAGAGPAEGGAQWEGVPGSRGGGDRAEGGGAGRLFAASPRRCHCQATVRLACGGTGQPPGGTGRPGPPSAARSSS